MFPDTIAFYDVHYIQLMCPLRKKLIAMFDKKKLPVDQELVYLFILFWEMEKL